MPNKKKCCPSCINDRGLKKRFFPRYHEHLTSGACSYCNTIGDSLIDPMDLGQYFEPVINIYRQDDNGKPIVECLKNDWNMFHPQMTTAQCKELLADILDDGEIVRKNFSSSNSTPSSRLDSWKKLREELMCKNRFFPKIINENDQELDGLEKLLGRLTKLLIHLELDSSEVPQIWYRARAQETDDPYLDKDMGAPPKHKASPGRANPAGIPYLYAASTQDTAISEIRPHTGELVSVATISFSRELRVIDLQNPRNLVSPFLSADDEDEEGEIASLRNDIEFLEHLGNELTSPVLPKAAAIDYIPSQYLCEFIKKCGYDGVVYKSAVGNGINLALFLPTLATIDSVVRHRVSKVSVEHANIS